MNPGLKLDKQHSHEWPDQRKEHGKFVQEALKAVVDCSGDKALFSRVRERYARFLKARGAQTWPQALVSPLALHLARAGSYENAGLCLHPVYGFAYIPGTGLKGMARAYAANIAKAPEELLERVFGAEPKEADAAGEVVFFDAWPLEWPKLALDIVNNHHPKYYQGTGDTDPPEDWEDPVPVNFLVVKPGATFEFALAARRAGGEERVALAREWLQGALAALGAGAKTNSGYGRFQAAHPVPVPEDRAQFTCDLVLVTPAFLAGPTQNGEDCDLRTATLRGLLRSWWRTLHSGYVSVAGLRKLEGRIWGTTEAGSALSLALDPVNVPKPLPFDREKIRREHRLVEPREAKRTQGLFYAAYGMERSRGKNERWYMPEGARWRLTIGSRAAHGWTAAQVLEQALAPLWLLSMFGGVGAKSRRGFGSLAVANSSVKLPTQFAEALERVQSCRSEIRFDQRRLASPSANAVSAAQIPLGTKDVWQAIDRLAYAYQEFAAKLKHKEEKLRLGLPRRIDSGPARSLQHPHGRQYSRHSSPLLFRLTRQDATFVARISAWHSPHLPDLKTSEAFLRECLEFMKERLARG